MMQNNQPPDLILVAEARKLLGVSTVKMAQLLKDRFVRYYSDPLDKRVKLVSRAEVLSLIIRDKAA